MACGITSINQSTLDECGSLGGIYASYGLACSDFTSATVASGEITALTIGAEFTEMIYDSDDTAFYNQEPDRQGKRITFNGTAFLKFDKVTLAKIQAARAAAECCCTIWIHRLNSGIDLVQGLDIDTAGTGVLLSKNNALVSPGIFSDTGDNSDRVEYTIEHVGRNPAPSVASALMADIVAGTVTAP